MLTHVRLLRQERARVLPSELLKASADLPRSELKKRSQALNGMINVGQVEQISFAFDEARQRAGDDCAGRGVIVRHADRIHGARETGHDRGKLPLPARHSGCARMLERGGEALSRNNAGPAQELFGRHLPLSSELELRYRQLA